MKGKCTVAINPSALCTLDRSLISGSLFQTQRYIDVDFNKLDTTLNLQTWVVILDFLGMGAKAHDPEQFTKEAQQNRKKRHPSSKWEAKVIYKNVNVKVLFSLLCHHAIDKIS